MLKSIFIMFVLCLANISIYAQTYFEAGKTYTFRTADYPESTAMPEKTWVTSVIYDKLGNAVVSRTLENAKSSDQIFGFSMFGNSQDFETIIDPEKGSYISINNDFSKYWLIPVNPSDGSTARAGGPILRISCPCTKNGECTPSYMANGGGGINVICVISTCNARCGKMGVSIGSGLDGGVDFKSPSGADSYLLIKAESVTLK